jgi:hypothetical protein
LRGVEATPCGFLKLQQTPRVIQQHLAIIRQCNRPRGAPKQRPPGLELEALDLLAYGRLREVELFGRTVEAAAISHGDEGAEEFEFEHVSD